MQQTNPAVTLAAFGPADQLHWQADIPLPTIKNGEVLLENHAAGVNPIDCKTRAGLGWGAEKFADHLPVVLGFDFAGVVVESKDARFQPGDRVCALNFDGGGYARFAAVNGDLLARIPDSVSYLEAGALPCAGATAWQLIKQANIQPGEHVVLSAPAGGVGHIALQLLADTDAVVSVIASAEKYERIKDYAKIAHWIDYRSNSVAPLKADLLLDLVGGESGIAALDTLRDGGRAICLPSIHVPKLKAAGAEKGIAVDGFIVKPDAETLDNLLAQMADKRLNIQIERSYPLREAAAAHHAQESGHTFGKLVLNISDEA